MARIAGVNIPDNKKAKIALTYIHGVGRSRAEDILREAAADGEKRVKELTEEQLAQIRKIIEGNFAVEGELRRKISQNIKRLKEIGSYRGKRHLKGLPVRGQKTRTNARTRKGKKKV
jgi:small subunit ribosomal protein S13